MHALHTCAVSSRRDSLLCRAPDDVFGGDWRLYRAEPACLACCREMELMRQLSEEKGKVLVCTHPTTSTHTAPAAPVHALPRPGAAPAAPEHMQSLQPTLTCLRHSRCVPRLKSLKLLLHEQTRLRFSSKVGGFSDGVSERGRTVLSVWRPAQKGPSLYFGRGNRKLAPSIGLPLSPSLQNRLSYAPFAALRGAGPTHVVRYW